MLLKNVQGTQLFILTAEKGKSEKGRGKFAKLRHTSPFILTEVTADETRCVQEAGPGCRTISSRLIPHFSCRFKVSVSYVWKECLLRRQLLDLRAESLQDWGFSRAQMRA